MSYYSAFLQTRDMLKNDVSLRCNFMFIYLQFSIWCYDNAELTPISHTIKTSDLRCE